MINSKNIVKKVTLTEARKNVLPYQQYLTKESEYTIKTGLKNTCLEAKTRQSIIFQYSNPPFTKNQLQTRIHLACREYVYKERISKKALHRRHNLALMAVNESIFFIEHFSSSNF
jgi:hypothetical protein